MQVVVKFRGFLQLRMYNDVFVTSGCSLIRVSNVIDFFSA